MTDRTSATELAVAAAVAADDLKATDIVVFEVGPILAICDIFVLASASNTRQVAAIANEVEEQVFVALDRRPTAVEGLDSKRWVLLDYGDVVVHVFLDEERHFYRLDRLYGDAARIAWEPAVSGDALEGKRIV